MSFFSKRYGMNQCRQILQQGAALYKKHPRDDLKNQLLALQSAIDAGDKKRADELARQNEEFYKQHYPKSWFKWTLELAFALMVALAVATVIRQMWFEPYEIPTGSMRPTFKEQDHLTVSKAQFGINIPLKTEHFYFDPDLVQRTSAIIFSGDGIALDDTDTTFMGVFPYKKRYVKRLIGKPGDTFAFYGGKLFAQDKEGHWIDELQNAPWMEKLDHIPMISFEGQPHQLNKQEIVFTYFNIPYAKVSQAKNGSIVGEVFNGKEWVLDDINAAKTPHDSIRTLSDVTGMRNYAMAQLYTADELAKEGLKADAQGVLYLVLRHTPNLDYSKGELEQPLSFPRLLTTVIPLQESDLKTIMDSMYTSRFVVSNGRANRYNLEKLPFNGNTPRLGAIPDGTYEFYFGKADQVNFGGLTSALPKDHPLYQGTPELVQRLYNLGTGWNNAFQPGPTGQRVLPRRYAYFRNGDLYLLGSVFLKKDDPRLKAFVEKELKKQNDSTAQNPYIAFTDHGAPDAKTLQAFGLKIPEKQYLALGDNHAMSADSRVFGFVPEANLQGVPEYIVWPIGDRLGRPEQKPYPTFTAPRLIVWAIAAVLGLVSYAIYCYRLRRRIEL